MKAEQNLNVMVNAMVSHELRNPLNALLGQMTQLLFILQTLKSLIQLLSQSSISSPSEFLNKLKGIYIDLKECASKISSSVKFVDHFVHDILDFAVMRKSSESFQKNVQVFDIREAVDDITSILKDKAEMKQIEVTTKYCGFPLKKIGN